MRKIKEILRLHAAGTGVRAIARSCGISHSTVKEALRRAEEAGLCWPLPESLSDADLEEQLYARPAAASGSERPEPDWTHIEAELQRPGVTLRLLWEEHLRDHPDAYRYSQFCERFRQWRGTRETSMRQVHPAGEKLFVDFAGDTIPVIDRSTGEVRPSQLFIAVLGASSYTYVEAVWTQALPDWTRAHVNAFTFFGGVPAVVVPDNLKAGVRHANRYEPELNPTYQELAEHYGVAVIPARVRRPKDKAKVESAVLHVERRIIAALRNRRFFSLGELNAAIRETLRGLNDAPFQKAEGSRRSRFETLERPALRPLPAQPYVYAEWRKATVNIDYHVDVDHAYYSVPHRLVRQAVEVRLTATTVEIFAKGKRVAAHRRLGQRGAFVTEPAHRPEAHKRYGDWSPARVIRWAESVGPKTAELARQILEARPHPEQGYRSCMGLVSLSKTYTPERVEAAATRALAVHAYSYRSVRSMLEKGLDRVPLETPPALPLFEHANLRGSAYYGSNDKGASSPC